MSQHLLAQLKTVDTVDGLDHPLRPLWGTYAELHFIQKGRFLAKKRECCSKKLSSEGMLGD